MSDSFGSVLLHYCLLKVFYIEMVCNDEELITENVKVIIHMVTMYFCCVTNTKREKAFYSVGFAKPTTRPIILSY